MGVLKENASDILLSDFEINKIIDREEETESLRKWLDKKINLIYVYGSSGTGKTYVLKKLLEGREDDRTICLYLNCKDLKSMYEIVIYCLEELRKRGLIQKFPTRGYSFHMLFNLFKKTVEENGIYFWLVIDEINRFNTKEVDELMYLGLEAYKDCKKGYIRFIVISNDPMLDMKFSESVKSRLSVKIHFPKYNVQQLLEILEEYAKISLKENSYTREDLFKIASHVGNFTGNARMAKRILYFVAEKSSERLDMSKLPESISEEEKLMWEKEIERLSLELRLTLLAVIRSNKKFEAERERFSLSKDLTRYTIPPSVQPTVKNIYNSYLEVCSEYGFNPKSEMTVRNSIDELDKQMLVRREIKGFGRAKGVTSVIFLRGFADVLEPIIRKSIEKIIS